MFTKLFPTFFWLYFSYVITFLLPLIYGFTMLFIPDDRVQRNSGRHPRTMLGGLFLVVGLLLIQAMLQDFYVFYTYQSLNDVPFSMNFGLALPPLLYLYFRKLMIPAKLSRKKLFFHLLPVSAVVFFEITVILLHYTDNLNNTFLLVANTYTFIYPAPLVLSAVLYLFYIVQLRKSYIRNLNDIYSFVEGIDLRWVNTMILLYTLLVAVILPSFLIQMIWLKHLSNIALMMFVSYLFIRSLREPYVCYESSFNIRGRGKSANTRIESEAMESPPHLLDAAIQKSIKTSPEASEEIAENTALPLQAARKAEIKTKLLSLFETEKVYLRNTLTLNEVAQMLHTNRTYISNIVNNEFALSFYQFVNKYRIDEATCIFSGNPDISSNNVAEMVGFNSISSFIMAFKLHKQCTPKEWRQINQNICKLTD